MLNSKYFQELENLSQIALKNGDVPISALIVNKKGEIIGKGYNKKYLNNNPFFHAEIIAIQDACLQKNDWRLDDCHLFVTFQPCLMCMTVILEVRIKKIDEFRWENESFSLDLNLFYLNKFKYKNLILSNEKDENFPFYCLNSSCKIFFAS